MNNSQVDWSDYKRTNPLALAILGIIVGHPKVCNFDDGSGGMLEELDNAFDECAWIRDWIEWDFYN